MSGRFSLQSARMRAAGVGKDFKENPNLRDNWTDAEGYYRKCSLTISPSQRLNPSGCFYMFQYVLLQISVYGICIVIQYQVV